MSCCVGLQIATDLLLMVASQATRRTDSYKLGELIATMPIATERAACCRSMGLHRRSSYLIRAGEAAIPSDGLVGGEQPRYLRQGTWAASSGTVQLTTSKLAAYGAARCPEDILKMAINLLGYAEIFDSL